MRRGFKQPPSYHIDRLRNAPVGHFYDVISNGYGAMLNYAQQVQPRDRWAIVAYIRALQYSQNANVNDLPAEARARVPAVRHGSDTPAQANEPMAPSDPDFEDFPAKPATPSGVPGAHGAGAVHGTRPGANPKDNDDDGTKLRNRSAAGGNAQEVPAHRRVRRTGFPRCCWSRGYFIVGPAAVSALVSGGLLVLVRHGHGLPAAADDPVS